MSSCHFLDNFFAQVLAGARKNIRRATVCFVLSALLSGLLTAGCYSHKSTDSGALKKVTFMLSWAPDTNHIGVYVAKEQGLFEQAGLDVQIVAVSQAGAEQAVNSGVADFALSNLTNVGIYNQKGATLKQVLQVQRKPSAIWCALAENTAINSPKDFDGKTFATFGSNESDAVIRRMIQTDGGEGIFDKITVGTSTFQTLSAGQADFGGFYATWEGVQAQIYGPQLKCFTEPDYGVPGNADSIGIITNQNTIDQDPETVKAFVQATQAGYEYAYQNPQAAAKLLVEAAPEANLSLEMVSSSMQLIVQEQYWGDRQQIEQGALVFGSNDVESAQQYFDFLAEANAYTDQDGQVIQQAPKAEQLVTDQFLAR